MSGLADTALKPMSVVTVDFEWMTVEQRLEYERQYPFKQGDSVLFLGEIENMPGHVAVVTREGKVLWGFHAENFRAATEDEV